VTFEELIKGKNVAIVGPAKYLTNSEYGSEINDHDVVVRLNRGYELVTKNFADIGNRTDILYSCLIERAGNAGKISPIKLKETFDIKMVVAPPHSDYKGRSNQTRLHELVDRKKVEEIAKLMPVRIVDHNFHNILAEKVECKPNTGFMAIYDLLRYKPSSLSIYGFSFYLDGFMDGCKLGVKEEENLSEQQFSDKCFNSKRHVQANMWQFAKKTLLNKGGIKLDKTLEKILKLPEFNKELFNNT
tara:strand:- start:951 stop:1682 length:732 start_codon:yes stop_codon:yes gene_type:complete